MTELSAGTILDRTTGLTRDEVRRQIAAGRTNRVERLTSRPAAKIIQNNVVTLFVGILATTVAAAALSVIVLVGLYVFYRVTAAERAPTAPRFDRAAVWAILLGGAALHVAAVYWQLMTDFLGLVPLDADSWITIIAAAGIAAFIVHILLRNGLRRSVRGS